LCASKLGGGVEPLQAYLGLDHNIDFRVRIGINTGPVVVADVGAANAKEATALGDAVHIAARMEQTADPGTVQVSGETHRFVAPLFEFESLGGIELKGKSDKIP